MSRIQYVAGVASGVARDIDGFAVGTPDGRLGDVLDSAVQGRALVGALGHAALPWSQRWAAAAAGPYAFVLWEEGWKPRAGFEPAVSGSAGRRVRPDSATLAPSRRTALSRINPAVSGVATPRNKYEKPRTAQSLFEAFRICFAEWQRRRPLGLCARAQYDGMAPRWQSPA